MQSRFSVKKLTRLSLLLAIALVLQYVESVLPYIIPVIPIHIGLANVAVLYILKNDARLEAFTIGVLRCILIALILGRVSALLYSLTGTVLSLIIMSVLLDRKGVSLYGVSVAGAFLFNMGQLAIGIALIGTSVASFIPWFGLLSIPCGLLTAYLAARIPKW